MCDILSFYKLEFEHLSNETRLRIGFQNSIINYGLLVSGAFLGIFGYVVKDDIKEVFNSSKCRQMLYTSMTIYILFMFFFICSYIHQTFKAIDAYECILSLKKRIELYLIQNDLVIGGQINLLYFINWRTLGVKSVAQLKSIHKILGILQPVPLYAPPFISILFLFILGGYLIPVVCLIILVILVDLHWHALNP